MFGNMLQQDIVGEQSVESHMLLPHPLILFPAEECDKWSNHPPNPPLSLLRSSQAPQMRPFEAVQYSFCGNIDFKRRMDKDSQRTQSPKDSAH